MAENTEVSVEEALKELREMCPDAKFVTVSGDYTARWSGEVTLSTRILIAESWRDGTRRFFTTNPTLNEAMAQVRAWKESQ